MKRLLSFAAFALLTSAVAVADNSDLDNPTAGRMVMRNDKALIQGTWVCVGVEVDGSTEGADRGWRRFFVNTTWTYKGDFMWNDRFPKEKAKFVLDPEKGLHNGGGNGPRRRFLYEFRGEEMRWCIWLGNDKVPPLFAAQDDWLILTLRHQPQMAEI